MASTGTLILPEWAQWFAALAPASAAAITACVAVAVAVIGYRQWRVAREKLVLDLFDRRFSWYFELKNVLFAQLDASEPEVHAAFQTDL